MKKILVIAAAFAVGYVFNWLHIPAGWLLGAMLAGTFYRLFVEEISYPPVLFDISLALIGVSISLSIKIDMFKQVAAYLLPLAVSMVILFVASWILGKILKKYSNMDGTTALFCCLPAGASIMMALSREYKANMSMVAAFQTVRIMLLVATIPLVAGLISSFVPTEEVQNSQTGAQAAPSTFPLWVAILFYALLVVVTLVLAKKWRIPIAPFLYSIILGFLFKTFLLPLPAMPNLLVGLGMAMLGVIIGVRFDRESLKEFKSIGWTSLMILAAFFLLTFITTLVFYLMTSLDFITSLLAIVPAGAPQMASVASSMDLDASIVAAMQIIRLLTIIVFIPMLVPLLVSKDAKEKSKTH